MEDGHSYANLSVVGTDELAIKMLACYPVYDVTIDLAVTVYDAILAREAFVFSMDVEGVRQLFCGTKFPRQILAIYPDSELVGVGGLVHYAVVYIVVRDTGASAEGNLTAKVWEEV